ncbi:MAG: DUF1553 domain-containing protein, partial [Planctomycetes bacterium]|nr:DUF1553 domain-containing protein [Planctomycetota bacterium]
MLESAFRGRETKTRNTRLTSRSSAGEPLADVPLAGLSITSATYRQSGRVTAEHLDRDPENRLHARAARFRMPSAVLRDWALAAGGLIDPRIGGPPVYPYQPDAIWESLAITKERDFTYPASHGADLYRRSLYTFWRRTVSPANMFDAASRQSCSVR